MDDEAIFSDEDSNFMAESPLRTNSIERKLLAGSSKSLLNPFAKRSEGIPIDSICKSASTDSENTTPEDMNTDHTVSLLDESIIFLGEHQNEPCTSTPLQTKPRKMIIRSSPYFLGKKRAVTKSIL